MWLRLLLFIIEIGIIAQAISAEVRARHWKRLAQGHDDPELLLPRRERRARARALIRREDDEYIQQQIKKNMQYIQEGKTTQ